MHLCTPHLVFMFLTSWTTARDLTRGFTSNRIYDFLWMYMYTWAIVGFEIRPSNQDMGTPGSGILDIKRVLETIIINPKNVDWISNSTTFIIFWVGHQFPNICMHTNIYSWACLFLHKPEAFKLCLYKSMLSCTRKTKWLVNDRWFVPLCCQS